MKSKTYRKIFFSFLLVISIYSIFVIYIFAKNEIDQHHAEENMKSQLLLQNISFQLDQQMNFAMSSFTSLADQPSVVEYSQTSMTDYDLYSKVYDEIKANNVLMKTPSYSVAVMNLKNNLVVSSDGYFLKFDFLNFLTKNSSVDTLLNEIVNSEYDVSVVETQNDQFILIYKKAIADETTYFLAYWNKNEMTTLPLNNLQIISTQAVNPEGNLQNISTGNTVSSENLEPAGITKESDLFPFLTFALLSQDNFSGVSLTTISSLLLPVLLLGIIGSFLLFVLSKRTYEPYLQALNTVKSNSSINLSDSDLSLAMNEIIERSTSLNSFHRKVSEEIKELFIKNLLLNQYDIMQTKNLLPSFHLEHLNSKGFIVFLSFLEGTTQDAALETAEIGRARKLLLQEIVPESNFETISFNENNFAVIITGYRQSEILSALDNFRENIADSANLNIYYFLSKPFSNIQTFKSVFLESYDWLIESFTESLSEQTHFEQEYVGTSFSYSVEEEQQLIHYLKVEDFRHATQIFEHILSENLQHDAELKNIFDFTTAFSLTIKRIIVEKNLDSATFYKENKNDFELLRYGTSPEQVNMALENIFSHLIESIQELSNSSISKIDEIIHYINENYQEDLYLGAISEKFGLTESYLSRLIKEKLDMTFKTYLNNLRVQKAKNIMASSNVLIQEVSEIVGFKNVNSFIRVFKQIEGITPGQFQRKKDKN
ncbi:helix-turn-helix domain-containing protein [Enterococcus sp. LJL90]